MSWKEIVQGMPIIFYINLEIINFDVDDLKQINRAAQTDEKSSKITNEWYISVYEL